MVERILLFVVPLVALLGGAVAGYILKPQDDSNLVNEEGEEEAQQGEGEASGADKKKSKPDKDTELNWFSFPTQFFIPVMRNGQVLATMILSLTIEMPAEATERIQKQEHRLRDALLRALMIHANTGGFDGNFTADAQMTKLRNSLIVAARSAAGDDIFNVLVEDIARQ